MTLVTDSLLHEIEQLHPEQRRAVLHEGNVVLRAGPGSGKTRTLVARAAYLLQTQVPAFRRVACITYTNAAAEEIRRRVARCGVQTDGRLTCSTVHSFCLNEILRAFTAITGERVPEAGQVLGDGGVQALLQRCFDEVGIAEVLARYRVPAITKIRRAFACDEPVDEFDPREVEVARLYEHELATRQEIDFEAMVTRGLQVVRRNERVRDLLRARFPHLIVDEYQDLGGVLHEVVLTLHDLAGVTVFAVGDTDQSLYGFTGAEARYLDDLAGRTEFLDIPLEVNYRSGQDIITAAEAALGEARGRSARGGAAPGEVNLYKVDGGLDDHARLAADFVEDAHSRGVALERIAILYPARGPLLEAVLEELTARGIPLLYERDEKLPASSICRFVQRCASRAVTNSQLQTAPSEELDDLFRRTEAPTLSALESELSRLRSEANLSSPPSRLTLLRNLQQTLDPRPGYPPDAPADSWLARLRQALSLDLIASRHPNRDNNADLDRLSRIVHDDELALQDLARATQVIGKTLVTTYHSSKGREFDTVILPGLLNGILPHDVAERGRWRSPSPKELAEQRRSFYVALTRAEHSVRLIVGPGYHTKNGYWISKGPSSLVVEMAQRLNVRSP
jgi:DNA helicase-2/ATP-dependent DNA helicase PcrA